MKRVSIRDYKVGDYVATYPEYLNGKLCYGKIVEIIESDIYGQRYDIQPDYDPLTEAGEIFTVSATYEVDDVLTDKMNNEKRI